jgi:ketosteroid isomerase-like protein
MSTTLKIARELFENISSEGDVSAEAAMDLLDDAVIWEVCPGAAEAHLPFCGVFHGKAGVRNWIAQLNEHAEILEVDRNYVPAEQGHVFCYGDARMRIRGRLTTFFFIEWVEVRDGKVVRYKEVIDTLGIVKQLQAYDFDVVEPAPDP